MACIYYIKNNLSGRMYIGQTTGTLTDRMHAHFQGSTEIDRDLKALGKDNFTWGIIDECTEDELDEKEIYYINKYDTYYNGYNNTLGGRLSGVNKLAYIKNDIVQDYKNGMYMIDLNIKYKIRSSTLRMILNSIDRCEPSMEYTNDSTIVIGYTKDWFRVGIFESIAEALRFVNEHRSKEGKPIVDKRNFYRTIKTACNKNGIASGYRWQYAKDVFFEGKQFNSTLDIQKYKLGFKCTADDEGIIYADQNKESNKQGKDAKHTVSGVNNYETELNEHIFKLRESGCTFKAIGEQVGIEQNSVRARYNRYCERHNIDRGTNKQDDEITEKIVKYIDDDLDTQQISAILGMSKDAIRMRYNRYCTKNGITSGSDRISTGIVCVELNKYFKQLNDAAKFILRLPESYPVTPSVRSVAYRIGLACKEHRRYKGYTWMLPNKEDCTEE